MQATFRLTFAAIAGLVTSLTADTAADRALASYFESEVTRLERQCVADMSSLEVWQARRAERKRELFDMLGLWPLPPRTELRPVVTGVVQHETFSVEKLHFQSLPGLYVTANLYLPRGLTSPAPAILYVCGHAVVKTNGVSLGNKTGYQHHGAWLAQHGYVCLTLDTVQLGEIEGVHHGTYRLGQWWWNSRGYTPAGVEAWNSIRALDYLETRPEVDRTRLGMTGRSGGGSYTWTTAALDDRVKVAAPVAGITDLRNQVVDGVVEGHCDCMFYLNTYRWDFALNAALIAPRPLLVVNTDADTIFPLDGVLRVHGLTRRVYELYGARTNLGLVIGPGGHRDTQDLQVPVFRWFDQHLQGSTPLITNAATRRFDPAQLRVFDTLPSDERNTRIAVEFVPRGEPPLLDTEADREATLAALRTRVFGGWPETPSESEPAATQLLGTVERDGCRLRAFSFLSQAHVPVSLWLLTPAGPGPARIELRVMDAAGWMNLALVLAAGFGPDVPGPLPLAQPDPEARGEFAGLRDGVLNRGEAVAWFAPRGIGDGAWTGDERKQIQIRRRFMLLGQTLEGMRVWDIRQAFGILRQLEPTAARQLTVRASGNLAVNSVFAALFEPRDSVRLELSELPEPFEAGPDYLNVLRVLDLPQAIALLRTRAVVEIP